MADASGGAKETDFNPRWMGYVYILVSSLVNFASVSNLDIHENPEFYGMYQASLFFGVTTFSLAILILVVDRFQSCCDLSDDYNYTKAKDGKVEGYTLALLSFFWIFGVGHITQVDGIAYVATNIYFSAWLTLFSCIYTLDKWSAAKDILSIEEMTGLSATLKSWYVLFLASLVAMGTSCDLHRQISEQHKSWAAYGIVLGLVSTLMGLFWILVHYRIVDYEYLVSGGWAELSASFCMILLWIVGVSILTSEGGIAATIGGSGCTARTTLEYSSIYAEGCYVVWVPLDEEHPEDDFFAGDTEVPVTPKPTPQTTPKPTAQTAPRPTPRPTAGATTSAPQSSPVVGSSQTPAPWADPSIVPTTEPSDLASTLTSAPSAGVTQEVSSESTPGLSPSNSPTSNFTLSTGLDDDNINTTDANATELTIPTDDDAMFEGEIELGFDDDFAGDGNATRYNFSTASNGTILEEEDPARRWLQETTISIKNITQNATMPPTPAPTNRVLPDATFLPTGAPTRIPYTNRLACDDILDAQIPGSNLYLAVWICFFASFNITLRWKAAQAIQFAQAQHRKADERGRIIEDDHNASDREGDDDVGGDNDVDDDDDDNL